MMGGCFSNSVLVEIRAAEGGNDAKLLVRDLFQIYLKWCKINNFKSEISYKSENSGKGYSIIEFIVTGKDVYTAFISEAGGHRFQRVPPTEKRGRVQTSTVTVAVLQLKEYNFFIDEKELRYETKKGSGAGGQHKNVTESAIKVIHIPTGITAECQDERSQHKNKRQALKILRARLEALDKKDNQLKENSKRKKQIGKGARGDKIRTYRYRDNRAIDHRTGKKVSLSKILNGNLNLFKGGK